MTDSLSDSEITASIGTANARDWAEIKQLWFTLAELAPDEQRRVLEQHAASATVKAHVAKLLHAAPGVGDRFDAPAHVALGFGEDVPPPSDVLPLTSLIGQRLGPYRIARLIGRGGMGAVYEAQRDDAQFEQRVAIKTLWHGADSDVLLQRFRAERQILAALQHPNIAQLIDGGATESGTPWLAMEYVDGVPIDRYCDEHSLPLAARLDLFRAVCHAVHHAHQRLVVHRDLKPGNVLVSADGTVKLLDFGVAKLLDDGGPNHVVTGDGLSPFTAAYAAPEQANGEFVSTATDVYALGALLCTLLAGAPPLDVSELDPVARLMAVRDASPRMPSTIARANPRTVAAARGFESADRLAKALEGELDAIVGVALRREPQRRYASANALSDDILRYLRRDRVLARRDTVGYRVWTFARRNRALMFGTTLGLVGVLIASMLVLRQAQRVRVEASRAERAAAFMAGIMSGPSMSSQDPMMRIGMTTTLGQLLDSAVLRVPQEFAGDDAIRARLYTAFGANYATQMRYRLARQTLDSARVLAARVYGRRSAEFGNASLELATLELGFRGPEVADSLIADAESSDLERATPLSARATALRAKQAWSRGRIRVADSIARGLVAADVDGHGASRVAPTTRVTAQAILMATSSWLRRDPREYLQRARAIIATTDSLGTQLSAERLDADGAEMEALLVLGRADQAEARARLGFERLRTVIGVQPALDLQSARVEALLSQMRGDSAAQRRAVERGWALLQTPTEFPVAMRMLFSEVIVDYAIARGDTALARRVAETTREQLSAAHSPLTDVFSHLYVGLARLASKDADGAERALRAGLEVVHAAPDLSSMGPRLRRPLIEALVLRGRLAEADSVGRLDPPKAAMPACTPGGRWVGCPDVAPMK